MAELPKHLCWLDLETSSLDPATTTILEVFWEITDLDLNPVDSRHGLESWPERAEMDDYVRAMHTASGLFRDAAEPTGWTPNESFAALNRAISNIGETMPLAGSGVAHFDRLVLAHQHPLLASKLTYWSLDLGACRRLAQLTGHADLLPPDADIAHRAEADVRRAQYEYRQWRDVFTQASLAAI